MKDPRCPADSGGRFFHSEISMDSWVQILKQRVVEKLPGADIQPVAYLLDGHDAGVFALFVEHAVNRGGSDAALIGQCVDHDTPLGTKRLDPPGYRLPCVHLTTSDLSALLP